MDTTRQEQAQRHTPGPWGWQDGFSTTWVIRAMEAQYPLFTRSMEIIAEIPRPDNDKRSFEETDANARLIAAAPELLEALRDTLAIASIKWGNLDPDANTIMDKARAAIAKATGGQP